MKRRVRWLTRVSGRRLWAAALLLTLAIAVRAAPGTRAGDGAYSLVRGVADQSSVLSAQNSTYRLQASVGQPFAAPANSQATRLGAGYWYGDESIGAVRRKVYIPIINR